MPLHHPLSPFLSWIVQVKKYGALVFLPVAVCQKTKSCLSVNRSLILKEISA